MLKYHLIVLYDANENTTYDPANKLTTLYNYLNLPSKFTKDDGSKQELVYDFSGKKWQENEYLIDGSLLSKRSYLSSFEFEGNSLQKVFHSSGFIQNLAADVNSGGQSNGNIIGSNIVSTQKLITGGKSEYIADKSICLLPGFESLPVFNAEIKPQLGYLWNYILSDHLGNTRVLFADKNDDGLIKQETDPTQNEVLSVSNYSPFGLELGGSQQNLKHQFDYKFNGKQNNGFSGLTDFGARWLDSYLAKWTTQDPLSEKSFNISTNAFVNNNPINMIDRDGRYAVSVHYQITYEVLRKMGYSHKRADIVAHYSSTYADHPSEAVRFADFMLHPLETNPHPYRKGIDYSKTAESQEEKNSHWHSMMSDAEAERGMTEEQAADRGLKFGWDNIFASNGGNDLGKLGQGLHALQDASAHKGMKESDHLGANWSSLKQTIGKDMYGSTKQASSITKSAIIVIDLLQGKSVNLKDGDKLNVTGMSAGQLKQVLSLLFKQGFQGKININ